MTITRDYLQNVLPDLIKNGHYELNDDIYKAMNGVSISDGNESGYCDALEPIMDALIQIGHPEEFEKYLSWVNEQQIKRMNSTKEVIGNALRNDIRPVAGNSAIKPISGTAAFIPIQPICASDLDSMELKPIQWVVKDLLTTGLTMLSAPPKYYKSFMALSLCTSVCTGSDFLGFHTEKHACLYFDLESTPRRPRNRLNLMLGGSPKPDNLHFVTSDMKPGRIGKGFIEQLEYQIQNIPDLLLVVIDVFVKVRSPAVRGQSVYDKDYEDSAQLKEIADRYDVCILLIHHNRKMKDSADVFNEMSGSSGILGSLDCAWVISKDTRYSDDAKLYTTGRDIDSKELCIKFNKDTFLWEYQGTPETIENTKRGLDYLSSSITEAVKRAVDNESGSWTGSASQLLELAEENGITIKERPSEVGKFFGDHITDFYTFDKIDCERLPRQNRIQPWRFSKMESASI